MWTNFCHSLFPVFLGPFYTLSFAGSHLPPLDQFCWVPSTPLGPNQTSTGSAVGQHGGFWVDFNVFLSFVQLEWVTPRVLFGVTRIGSNEFLIVVKCPCHTILPPRYTLQPLLYPYGHKRFGFLIHDLTVQITFWLKRWVRLHSSQTSIGTHSAIPVSKLTRANFQKWRHK